MCVIMFNMKTATVREVQHHLNKVLAWVENGEEVQITRRSKTVARLVPSGPAHAAPAPLPDFAARTRAIWGKPSCTAKTRSLAQAILAEREE